MSDLKTSLHHLAERGSAVGSERLRERVAMELAGAPSRATARAIPRWAIVAAVAVATIVAIGGPLVFFSGSDRSLPPAQSTTPPPSSTAVVEVPTTVLEVPTTVPEARPPVGAWSALLSTKVAKVPPPAATCPSGATPDLPGPPDQARPGAGPWNNQPAVFDTHAGRIVFVDEAAETWTFDVCTNTWERMEPEGVPYGNPDKAGVLVYDVDSNRTIAFGPALVSVYDATANAWSRRPGPANMGWSLGWPGLGAVYDPASGLVLVVTDDGLLTAYDVDTDTWTDVGVIVEEREIRFGPPFLIGHVAEIDRLVFLGFGGAPFQDQGSVINPRTGETVPVDEPEGGVWGGFGLLAYAAGGETAYTFGDGVCRLESTTLDWDCNAASRQTEGPSAMVYDPINDRVVVINDFCCNWPGTTVTDAVYAVDFSSGERTELLAAASTRIERNRP